MDFTLKKYGEVLSTLGRGDYGFGSYRKSQSFIVQHDVGWATQTPPQGGFPVLFSNSL